MADKYLDSTLYTYAATPTWGTAQEGDGTATGAATPATMSLDMTGWTFTSGSSTFSVMGCTALTVGAGANSATNAQYSATLTTMIDNMVVAINLATASVVNVPAGWTASQVRNTVFARRTGNSLELMTRAGSAGWNTLTAMTFANVTGSSSGTWASGAGGAWGWLFNVAAIWPSSVAAGSYGLWAATQPLAGKQDGGDVVYVRANNQMLTVTSNSNWPVAPSSVGTTAAPVRHMIDSGNKWSGDSSTATLTIGTSYTGAVGGGPNFSAASLWVIGQQIGTKLWNLKWANNSNSGGTRVYFIAGKNNLLAGFNASVTAGNTGAGVMLQPVSSSPGVAKFRDFTLTHPGNMQYIEIGGSGAFQFDVRNFTLRNTGNTVPNTVVLPMANTTIFSTLADGVFEDFIVGSALMATAAGLSKINFIDCDYGNITVRGLAFGSAGQAAELDGYVASYTTRGNRDTFLDTTRGLVEWNSGISQPTLRATLPDGTTKWSWKLLPLRSSTNMAPSSPLKTLRSIKLNTLSSAARTFTAEFCISDTLSWTKADVAAVVRYRNAAGELVTLDTFDPAGGALTASTQTWSAESGGKVTFSSGGTLYHNKYKLSIATPVGHDLPIDAEVEFVFCVNTAVANTTQFIFVDPDIDIA